MWCSAWHSTSPKNDFSLLPRHPALKMFWCIHVYFMEVIKSLQRSFLCFFPLFLFSNLQKELPPSSKPPNKKNTSQRKTTEFAVAFSSEFFCVPIFCLLCCSPNVCLFVYKSGRVRVPHSRCCLPKLCLNVLARKSAGFKPINSQSTAHTAVNITQSCFTAPVPPQTKFVSPLLSRLSMWMWD